MGVRVSRFGDSYNLFRVISSGTHQRILVPRNMAPEGSPVDFSDGLSCRFKSVFVPRNPEQARVVHDSVQLIAQGHSFLIEAPTGSGKTAMAMDIIAKVGKKTLVVVTKEDIRDQWVAAAKQFLMLQDSDIGFIQGNTCSVPGKKLVIAMIQSLSKEDRYPSYLMRDFGMCVFDEVHHVAADSFSQACFRVPARIRLGLSATADRKDGRMETIVSHIGPIRVRSVIANMIPKIIMRESPWVVPTTRVRLPSGDYRVGPIPHSPGRCGHIINLLASSYPRNKVLAEFIVAAYHKGRCSLVQSDRKEHLETLSMMAHKLGVPSAEMAYYVGGMSEGQREEAKQRRVIFSTYAMTADATNIPKLDTLVMATPKSDVRQIVGRILRVHEGKMSPVVFDLVDSSSSVFSSYARTRKKWYASIGAEVSVPASVKVS